MMTFSRTMFAFLAILLAIGPLPVQGQKAKVISLPTAIQSVTVYRDRALVKRGSRQEHQPGHYVFRIANLPLSLLDESVRVSGSGSAAAKILDIKIRNERLEKSVSGRIAELEKDQREMEKQIRVLTDRMDLLNRKDDLLKSLLSSSGAADKEQELQKKGIAEWSRIIDFLEGNLNKIYDERRSIDSEKANILDKKAVVDHELSQQSEMREREKKCIEVDIEISHGGSLQVEVSYIVPQVSWTPAYDMRFFSEKNDAGLTCQALVRQETGEDWENIGLTLSTARPLMENSLPELNPQTLDRPLTFFLPGSNTIYGQVILPDSSTIPGVTVVLLIGGAAMKTTISSEEGEFRFTDLSPGTYDLRCELEGFKTSIQKGIRLAANRNISLTIPMDTSAIREEIVVAASAPLIDTRNTAKSYSFRPNESPGAAGSSARKKESHINAIRQPIIQEMEIPAAGVSAQAVAATFALKQRETILSNNSPQKVTMAVETIPFQREYQAIPKLLEQSFLKAAAINSTSFPLLAGKVSVFYDENFVSSTQIPQVSSNEKFTIPIGDVSGIKVKRELVEKKTDESGLFSRKVRTVFEYRITVENFQKSEEAITIIDQVPVSENKDIAIEILSVTPTPLKPKEEEAEKEKREGVLKWLLQLKPLEKKTIQFKYSVTRPRKLDVYNLD